MKGKIDFLRMVKGPHDPNYRRFLYEYARLDPSFVLAPELIPSPPPQTRQAGIFTEGKTDVAHLKAALRALQRASRFTDVHLVFNEEIDPIGATKLASMCDAFSKVPTAYLDPHIFIFDRDDSDALARAKLTLGDVHEWGSNVFSIAIPIPPHRASSDSICLELLYPDHDVMRPDQQGRRLFLSTEFHPDSGRHLDAATNLNYRYPGRLHANRLFIIDNDVFDAQHRNVALPKAQYALNVLTEAPGFAAIDFSAFGPLIERVRDILFGTPTLPPA